MLLNKHSEHTRLGAADQEVCSPLFAQITACPVSEVAGGIADPSVCSQAQAVPQHSPHSVRLITIFAFNTLACL